MVLHNLKRTMEENLALLPPALGIKVENLVNTTKGAHGSLEVLLEDENYARKKIEHTKNERRRLKDGYGSTGFNLPSDIEASLNAKDAENQRKLDRILEAIVPVKARYKAAKSTETSVLDVLGSIAVKSIKPVKINEPKGATTEDIRQQLQTKVQKLTRLERAPAPKSQIAEAIGKHVDAISAEGAPQVDNRIRSGDPAKIAHRLQFVAGPGVSFIGDAGASFFVWLLKDEIKTRLIAMVPDDGPGALSNEEQAQQIAKLQREIFELECLEEKLINRAASEGRYIARRPDADPMAILGIEIVGRR